MCKVLLSFAALVAALAACTFLWLPGRLESTMNRVLQKPPYHVPVRARELQRHIQIAHLHADSLL